jgi:threonine dehydratase
MVQAHRLSIHSIAEANNIIDPVFLNSPQVTYDEPDRLPGVKLVLKIETLNPIRSFKGRGADLLVSRLTGHSPIVCASAGNFGQAIAYSCRKRGIPLKIYAATGANAFKIERMRALGAEVILYGEDFDAAKIEARRMAAEQGLRFVEDALDIETLEGAGTIGLELLKLPVVPDVLIVSLGNGALFNGLAFVMRHYNPATQLVAVQAKGAPAMVESYHAGRAIIHKDVNTIADGIAVRIPIEQALKDMEGLADDTMLVSDEAIIRAMQWLLRNAGIVAEPAGAAGMAAILENAEVFKGKTVATVVCGGNLTEEQVKKWLG